MVLFPFNCWARKGRFEVFKTISRGKSSFFAFFGKNASPIVPATCSFHFGMRNPSARFRARPNRTVSFWKRWRSRKTFRIDQGHQGCPRSPVWTPWRVRHAIWSSVRPDARQNPRFQNPWYGNMFSVVNHQCPAAVPGVGAENHWQPRITIRIPALA